MNGDFHALRHTILAADKHSAGTDDESPRDKDITLRRGFDDDEADEPSGKLLPEVCLR